MIIDERQIDRMYRIVRGLSDATRAGIISEEQIAARLPQGGKVTDYSPLDLLKYGEILDMLEGLILRSGLRWSR